MTTTTRTRFRWRTAAMACFVAGVLLGAVVAPAQMRQTSVRTLSGKITDSGREPIRGAVVELRNNDTRQVVTYITDNNGRYIFKRLDSNTDYEVWVLFRNRRSPPRTISKFDSHMAKVINFKVRTY